LLKDLSRTAQAGFLALGNGSQTLASLAIAVLLSRLLTKDDYATFRQTFLTYQFCAPLLALGLPAAVLYFLPREPERAKSTILEILSLTAISGALFAAFFLLGGAGLVAGLFDNPGLEITLKWFAFYPLLILPTAVLKPLLITQKRAPWITGFSFGEALIRVGAVSAPIFLIAREPVFAIQGLIAGGLAVLLPTLALIWHVIRDADPDSGTPAGPLTNAKQILAYSVPLSIGSVIGTFNVNLDKLLVSTFESPEVFAVFVNGAMEIPLIGLITGSAAAIITPEISRLYREEKYQEAVALFRRAALKCGSILIPLGGALLLVAPELMVALYGSAYEGSATYFRMYLILLPFRAMIYGVLFQAAGRTDLVMVRAGLMLVLNAVLSVSLLQWLGPVGVVLGTIVATVLFAVPYCLVTASRLFQTTCSMLVPVRALLVAASWVVAALVAAGLLSHVFPPASVVIRATGAGCVLAFGLIAFHRLRKLNDC